jgi:dihydrodipicolinate synthase/N-acetylneuraminate lyase
MFRNRKRFLRVKDKLFNLDHVQMIRYAQEEKKAYFIFGADDVYSVIPNITPNDFERIVSALKHGKVTA